MASTTSGKPFDEFTTPHIEFVGEQDGAVERQLKEAIAAALREDAGVAKAYLARVRYDGKTASVVLGLLTDGDDSEPLVTEIGAIFASIFNGKAHLDVLFLSHEQNADIRKVCPAFYARTP